MRPLHLLQIAASLYGNPGLDSSNAGWDSVLGMRREECLDQRFVARLPLRVVILPAPRLAADQTICVYSGIADCWTKASKSDRFQHSGLSVAVVAEKKIYI